ncbi:MAG: hypothetical protein J6Y48_11860, partial [Clostridia bacterium]|nr:hypothetical protein [Clostridia bacterium]
NFGANQAERMIEAAYKYMKQGIQSELDTYALQDTLRKQVEADEEGYENWLKEQLNGAIVKSGIRNNKDFFDRMGNRRSWETLHDPETLENVVRVMKAQLDKGATGFFSQSELLALGTKDFKSLDDIRKDKARLQHISDEEMSAAKTDIINRFDKLVTALADPRESNQFIERDRVFSAIADTVRTARIAEGIQRIMNEWRYKVTAEQAQEIADLMVEISNLPTEYFEAKPKRAVGLDEIAKVLVPEGVDQELLDALDDQGIAWEFYDGTSEDRLAKMNANDDVKFSKWTESGMDVNYWMEHATPSMVQTEDERELISMYRGKRTSISLSLKKQGEYRARIRQLEAVDNPSTDVKSELTALRNKLEIEKKKVYRLEEEILQITRNDGWAGMMYQHNMVFRDYVEGRTQEQVRQTIDDMLKLVEQTQEQVTKDTENLKKLATHQAVQTMKSFMGKTSMGKMASILRKTYNSTMNKAEIEDRLAEMALKQASGKDITSDTEALAQDLLDRMRGIRTDTLESLRGQTFVIGQSLADELRKENSSIKELQSRIKGSGIKIVTGVKSSTGEIDKHSRISEQWSELRESNAALPDVENMAEIDKLHTMVDFIDSELRASTGAEQF